MEYFIPVIVFLFGTVLGSFLGMVIWRHNTGRDFGGRSSCDVCARNLRWYELVPVFSWLGQGGKCRMCKTKVSPLYPIIEVVMGFVVLFIFSRFVFFLPNATGNFFYFVGFYTLIFSILLVIAGYDLRHKIVPNNLVYPAMFISFVGLFLSEYGVFHFHPATIMSIAAGPLVALPLFFLWAVSKGEWLGFGDVKLAVVMGFLLGTGRGFAALMLAFWIGAIVGIIVMIVKGSAGARKMQIPFAPFLVAGTLLAFFFDITVTGMLNFFR